MLFHSLSYIFGNSLGADFLKLSWFLQVSKARRLVAIEKSVHQWDLIT